MAFSRSTVDSIEVISFNGSLDAAAAPKAREELKALIAAGHPKFICDLSSVRFIDSSGLSVLVSALKSARQAGGNVALVRLPPQVRSIIELTRLHRVFDIFDSEQDAAKALKAS